MRCLAVYLGGENGVVGWGHLAYDAVADAMEHGASPRLCLPVCFSIF